MSEGHVAVMAEEVVELLRDRGLVLDLTLGGGGHSEALLDAGVGIVIGLDRDPDAVEVAAKRLSRFGERFRAVHGRFSEVEEVDVPGPVDGVLFDLGVSSMQLDTGERGFAYRADGPLDMRMDKTGQSAADLVNGAGEAELADLIFQYGQEPRARRIARAIVRARSRGPIETTDALARVVAGAVGRRPGGPHPARRTFQALRIAVNRELEELTASLPQAAELLAPGGRVLTIAYHSLEDGIAKRFFRDEPRLRPLTKKPVRPTAREIASNPRARSARLRAAEKQAA